MINNINKFVYFFINKEFIIFLLVGLFNTAIAMIITYSLYNFLHFGYYLSSFIGVFIAAIIGFFLNRRFTFKSNCSILSSMVKFFTIILCSYIIAFTLSHKIFLYIFKVFEFNISINIIEQIAILFAQIIFTLFNFTFQKLWTFKK